MVVVVLLPVVVVFGMLVVLAVNAATTAQSLTVHLTSGAFRGLSIPNGTERWLGIPYAQPPVGSLRFKAPVPITRPVGGVKTAATFGDACPQLPASLGAPMSEDCLYLNVWRPNGTPSDAKLPVLAYIYVRK